MSLPELERTYHDGPCRSAEEIFEFCEGSLEPEREREVRIHLRCCTGCRRLYEREMSLSGMLSGFGGENGETPRAGDSRGGLACRVTMELPTRSVISRAVWGAGAAALLGAVLVTLSHSTAQPVTVVIDFMATLWGLTSGLSDAAGVLLAVSGTTILIALIVGVLVDALIVATLLAVARWWRPRGV